MFVILNIELSTLLSALMQLLNINVTSLLHTEAN